MFYSWYSSYPLSIDSLSDFAFNHISPLFWFSLSLMLISVYLIALTGKSNYLKWMGVVGIFALLHSLSYFYFTLPTSDSQFFRGLTEYFVSSNNVSGALKPSQLYFEWPSFFILNKMAISVLGISARGFEFIAYSVIGFLLTTVLYAYFSKVSKGGAFFAVIGFSLAMFNFLNYQWVPFTMAFTLFLVLVMLDAESNGSHGKQSLDIITVVLVVAIAFTHPFVPLFYILYTLVRYLFSRERRYLNLSLFSCALFMLVQVFQAPLNFVKNLNTILTHIQSTEYNRAAEMILQGGSNSFDATSQLFSKFIVIVILAIFGISFTTAIIKKKMQRQDIAIFASGIVYMFAGGVTQVLGTRAIPILCIPVCCSGAYYLFKSRFGSYLKYVFLILLMLFPFVLVHSSFFDSEIFFQTKEAYDASNFMIDHYNWTTTGLILAHIRVITYLEARQPLPSSFESESSPLFPRISKYETIVYTIGLGKNLLKYNYTQEKITSEIHFNQVYSNGFSYILMRSS
jgi:hypothetical protein